MTVFADSAKQYKKMVLPFPPRGCFLTSPLRRYAMQGINSVERNDLKRVELLSVSVKHALTTWKTLPGVLQAEQSTGGAKQMELHVSSQFMPTGNYSAPPGRTK